MRYGARSFSPRPQVDPPADDWGEFAAWARACAPACGDADADLQTAQNLRLFYRWCQRWTATLCRLRGDFDGDLDQYLLLLVFIHAEVARSMTALSAGARRDLADAPPPRGINALSVSEICRIPRETTRRKLGLLVKKDFLAVHQDGLFYLTERYALPQALRDLLPLMAPADAQPRSWSPQNKNGGSGVAAAAE